MTSQTVFDADYVHRLRKEAAAMRVRAKRAEADQQRLVRLSTENLRLRDRLTEANDRAARAEGFSLQLQGQVARRDQTIGALRAVLSERNITHV